MDGEPQSEFDVAVATVAAPSPDLSPELALIRALEDTGATFPDPPAAVALIEQAFEAAGDQRGADCLARMAARLGGTSSGEALCRVISGDTEPLRDTAARVGVSHVALFKQEKTIRKRLGLTASPYVGQKILKL
jgi:hypothetical protein